MLQDAGFKPTIFEKSRGLGGRMANRRVGTDLAFDHGVQYVTARSPAFQARIGEAVDSGFAEPWRPQGADGSQTGWIVGKPGMNALVKPMADGLDIRLGIRVERLGRDTDGWRVVTTDSDIEGPFDTAVCTVPAPQLPALLPDQSQIVEAAAVASIAPCWALMVAFESPLDWPLDIQRSEGGDLSWIARNGAKPGRSRAPDCWVAHASPEWSARHLEKNKETVQAAMLEMLAGAIGAPLPNIGFATVHRWRYAMTTTPLGVPFLEAADGSLFVGGDWCLGARVECAFESGQAIAEAIARAPVRDPDSLETT